MTEERKLTLYETAEARGNLDALCEKIEVLEMQLTHLPSRAYLSRTLLIVAAPIWALVGAVALLLIR